MFKSILKIQKLRPIQANYLSIDSIRSNICQDEIKNNIKNVSISKRFINSDNLDNFKTKTTNLNNSTPKSIQEDFENEVMNCRSVASLFKLISPKLTSLDQNQLEITFGAINSFVYRSTYNSNIPLSKLNDSIQKSIVFNHLLNRSNKLMKDLNSNCLIKIFRTLESVGYDLQNEIVKNCIKELDKKSNEFDLYQIMDCLKTASFYLENSTIATTELHKLKNQLIELARTKILNNQFDLTDINSILKCFKIFLNAENDLNRDIINHLIQILLSPNVQLNFKQSTDLLKIIKQNHFLFKRMKELNKINEVLELNYKRKEFYPKSLSKLIDKCNSTIFNKFSSEQTDFELNAYLYKIHQNVDQLNNEFINFYDQRFLCFLIPFLSKNFKNSNLRSKTREFAYHLAENHRRFNVYDEKLLKLIYELVCVDERLRMENGLHFYLTYSKLRLPFINHRYFMSKLLFETPSRAYASKDDMKNNLILLCRLILNDMNDERILNHLNNLTNNLTRKDYESINKNEFPEIKLANIYLSMYSKMNDNLKSKINSKLNQIINELKKAKKNYLIGENYYNINNKLQRNGYLSNGLFINTFAIFDRSLKNLLPLNGFIDYFDKVDQICSKLNETEELVTTVYTLRLKGEIKNYGEIYNYQMNKILNHYNIKTIEVCKDDLIDLDPEDQVKFLIKKILANYK